MAIRCVEEMTRPSVLGVCVDALGSTWLSKNWRIGKLEWQRASKNSELSAATVEQESTKHRLRFAEEAVSLMWGQV